MKYAIWTAVSTLAQAKDDKVSLEEQEKRCRAYATAQGWVESAGPFIAAGYSRTGYFNLDDAARDIPPISELLANLQSIDVLVMYSYDRMGDVLPMLAVYFRQNKKQILSVSQLTQLQAPDKYDPYSDEGGDIMQDVARITQRFRIADIRRKWRAGIPSRIDKGLHPLSIPFGYAIAGEGQPAVQVPTEIKLLRKMKDWMLSGLAYAEICRRADTILPPRRSDRWQIQVVRRMLINPYYAGLVRFNHQRTIEGGKRLVNPISQQRIGKGKHIPIWDEATYRKLIAEYKRRRDGHVHYTARYPFSGLTVCGVCGSKIAKHGKPPYSYLACESSTHWAMRYEKALDFLTSVVIQGLREYQQTPPQPVDLEPVHARLAELKTLRLRVQSGYESGLYTPQEASTKLAAIEEEADDLHRKLEHADDEARARQDWREKMGDVQGIIEKLPVAIHHGESIKVNQLLSSLIEKITLKGETVQISWRK